MCLCECDSTRWHVRPLTISCLLDQETVWREDGCEGESMCVCIHYGHDPRADGTTCAGVLVCVSHRCIDNGLDHVVVDAEKHKAKHTPRSLAQDILAKNGYKSSSPTKEKTTVIKQKTPDVVLPVVIEDSPDALTEAQRLQIEHRRREALERRKQKLAMLAAPIASRSTNHLSEQERTATSRTISVSHRASPTPDYFRETQKRPPATVTSWRSAESMPITAQKNPSRFLDELEAAAADIIKWEEEQVATNAVESECPTISDARAAASDVVGWEMEHQNGETRIVSGASHRLTSCFPSR